VTVRRIGVNLLWLSPGRVGGSEAYCVRLLSEFADVAPAHADLEVRLFVNRRFATHYEPLIGRLPTDVAPVEGDDRLQRIMAEHRWLVDAGRHRRTQVMHHMGGTVPLRRSCPAVVLIHDLQAWALPENFSSARRRYLRAVVPRSVRDSVAITTLSRWVQLDVHERLGAPLDRMVQIPPGADGVDDSSMPGATQRESTLRKYDLIDRPFFLYPAITYPHKNHGTLIKAFAEVRERHPDAVLVLTGGAGGAEREVDTLIDGLGLRPSVRRTGRIPSEELDSLYQAARALTFPSRYEGFGMPVLEAMTRGCAVVASRSCALPEVVGGGGTLIDAEDVRAWSSALSTLLDDPGALAQARSAAASRATEFRWSESVEILADFYRRVTAPANSALG
jgi:alpha-1,3-rhamnosyl/mannosyltransferase